MTTKLSTVSKFVKNHPDFATEGGIRHLIFHSETNGFYKVIRRLGRRILIDEEAFFIWLNNENNKRGSQC
jgi:hypothetical protein